MFCVKFRESRGIFDSIDDADVVFMMLRSAQCITSTSTRTMWGKKHEILCELKRTPKQREN